MTGFSRDEAGFREFVLARSGALGRTAYLLTGDAHLAEDLLQEALALAARHWSRIDQPEAYVRRTLATRNISRWRRKRVPEVSLAAYDAPGSTPDHDLRLTLERALARLTPKQRTVLVLRFFTDLTEVQTAHELGVSPGTVKSTTRHALARIRALNPGLAVLVGADS